MEQRDLLHPCRTARNERLLLEYYNIPADYFTEKYGVTIDSPREAKTQPDRFFRLSRTRSLLGVAGLRRSYLAFNAALGDLYSDDLLRLADTPDKPDFDDTAFFDAAGMVYNAGGFDASQLSTPEARRLIAETLKQINRAISSGVSYEVPETVRHALENNAFIFSGFKAYHTLREVGLSLTTDTGEIKPFEQFRRDVGKVNNQYNHNYLYAEYNHAVGASLMAERWQKIEADGDKYDLQYRTAMDDRVREDHAILHNTTLPPLTRSGKCICRPMAGIAAVRRYKSAREISPERPSARHATRQQLHRSGQTADFPLQSRQNFRTVSSQAPIFQRAEAAAGKSRPLRATHLRSGPLKQWPKLSNFSATNSALTAP